MLPGDPFVWSWILFIFGMLLAVFLGMFMILPGERKLATIVPVAMVFILSGIYFWSSVLEVLNDRQNACLDKAALGFKRASECADYGLADSTIISLYAFAACIVALIVGVVIGLIDRVAFSSDEVQV